MTALNDNPSTTSVLILAGGKGSRLRSINPNTPKTLASINNQPFLEILLNYLLTYSFRHFIICTGYKSEMIESFLQSSNYPSNVKIEISKESKPLGTAGPLKNAQSLIKSNDFLVLNGDSFINVDYKKLLLFYKKKSAKVLLTLNELHNSLSSGTVKIDDQSRIVNFSEKNIINQNNKLINSGVYIFNKMVLDFIPIKQNLSLEYNLLPKLIQTHPNLCYGFKWQGDFIDIGTPRNYKRATNILSPYMSKSSPKIATT